MKAKAKEALTLVSSETPNKVEDQISRRAYEFYEARGRENGHDVEDWLRAEAEVVGSTTKAA